MADRHLYEVRDGLYALIDDAADVHSLCNNCETILTVLQHTQGLWLHAEYAYKAVEVCERARRAVGQYQTTCQHHKTHAKLQTLSDRLATMADAYHKAKCADEDEQRRLATQSLRE
jgi:hypothetical protein